MEQQSANAFCGWNFVAGTLVRLNVRIVKERFAVLDPRERITDVGFARTDRFNLAPLQLNPRFVAVNDMIIPQRLAIDDGFSCHVAKEFCASVAASCSVRCHQRIIDSNSIALRQRSLQQSENPAARRRPWNLRSTRKSVCRR